MVLENIVHNVKKLIGPLGIAAMMYGCGDKAQSCVKDTDCYAPRICVQSECKNPGSDGTEYNCVTEAQRFVDACCNPDRINCKHDELRLKTALCCEDKAIRQGYAISFNQDPVGAMEICEKITPERKFVDYLGCAIPICKDSRDLSFIDTLGGVVKCKLKHLDGQQ